MIGATDKIFLGENDLPPGLSTAQPDMDLCDRGELGDCDGSQGARGMTMDRAA